MGLGVAPAQVCDDEFDMRIATTNLPHFADIIGMPQPVSLRHVQRYPGSSIIYDLQNVVGQKKRRYSLPDVRHACQGWH